MDRAVNRIKLNKLHSYPEIFDPIEFSDGVNLILGEKSDISTVSGRKTNGVGKSMCIEFINFCLLKEYSKSRIRLIPSSVLNESVQIMLDLTIGKKELTICRSVQSHDKATFKINSREIEFEILDDAKKYLSEMIYNNYSGELKPSFRELIAPLMREEQSEFNNILRCFKKQVLLIKPFIFFFNISLEIYENTQRFVKNIEELKKVAGKLKIDLTENNTKKISDIKIELNSLDHELDSIRNAIDSFKSNEAFSTIEKELLFLEDALEKLRATQNALKYELQKIHSLPKPEEIDNIDIEIIYNKFKSGLGDLIVKSLEETIGFKNKIDSFQRTLINNRALEIQKELDKIAESIRKYDDEYSTKIKTIDQKGVLKNLKASLKIYEQKNNEFLRKKVLFSEHEQIEREKSRLRLDKSMEIATLNKNLDEKRHIIEDSFLDTISSIHEIIMGNRKCSFSVYTIDKNDSKKTLDFEMRTYDDGSHSVERTKVFIFDTALLFNEHTRLRHPLILIHDNIFDVDQDTLVQSLNYMAKQEEKYLDFQYILTLNRDKIENEERQNDIKLDIEKHRKALFTKEHRFLRNTYQEL